MPQYLDRRASSDSVAAFSAQIEEKYALTTERVAMFLRGAGEMKHPLDLAALKPLVRLFYAFDRSTWLIAYFDEVRDVAFGCAQVGDDITRLCNFSLDELAARRWRDRCAINLDPDFETDANLWQWQMLAKSLGSLMAAEQVLDQNYARRQRR